MKGKVFLVGAGPGDPDLLTVKALRILRRADVVLHDGLISNEILELISSSAEVLDVGKRCGKKWITQEEIHALMIGYAREDRKVVRLKGGDPMIFGRAGEEMAALREAEVDFEVVPGITAASAAAAAAGIPLTDRRHASSVLLTTGRRSSESAGTAPAGGPGSGTTAVIYMPGRDPRRLREELSRQGFGDSTPCLIVSQAASENQNIHATTLGRLEQAPALPAPCLLIAGEVAAGRFDSKQDPVRTRTAEPESIGHLSVLT